MIRATVPLELSVEVQTSSGSRYRWGDNESPERRLLGVSFSTEIGDGFKSASGTLRRRFDTDYPDLNLVDTVSFIGADGSVAWEGRNAEMPRDLSDKSSIGVTLAGWMSHAKDRPFTEVFVDRDASAWQRPSVGRRAVILGASFTPNDPASYTDPTDASAGVSTGFNGPWGTGYTPVSEAWYDIGPGLTIGKIAYSWKRDPTIAVVAPWAWSVNVATDDKATVTAASGNLLATGPSASTFTPSVRYRYGFLSTSFPASGAGTDGNTYNINWYNLAVYGSHDLTTHVGEAGQPPGVYASDVIRNLATRFCPKLDTSGITGTDYVIQHLTFKDLTDPYDAFLQVNKYHLWNLAVWEDKKLTYSGYDLSDYDWQIRAGENGATFQAQGQSTDNVFNGVVVTFTDVLTGVKNILLPGATYPDLLSSDPLNPWTLQGISRWMKLELSTPTVAAQALQVGRIALAEANRPKSPGTLVAKGYIQDRAGNWQPGWKPRAGDTVAITNHPNDAPRLIHATTWDNDSGTMTMAIDAPPPMLDAYMDRLGTAITARGLS